MALDAIDSVRAAELEAEEITRAANQKAALMVSEAEREAVRILNEAEDRARDEASEKLAAAHAESTRILQSNSESLGAEMDALQDKARSQKGEAVRVVLQALA